jgi:hypothetical protein
MRSVSLFQSDHRRFKVLNASESNCAPLSTVIAFGIPNRQMIFCQKKNFWTVAEVIIASGLPSIHFEKYSTATTTYLIFPWAGDSGPSKYSPHLCNDQVG